MSCIFPGLTVKPRVGDSPNVYETNLLHFFYGHGIPICSRYVFKGFYSKPHHYEIEYDNIKRNSNPLFFGVVKGPKIR
jgi:hypothetical protein